MNWVGGRIEGGMHERIVTHPVRGDPPIIFDMPPLPIPGLFIGTFGAHDMVCTAKGAAAILPVEVADARAISHAT